MKHHQKQSCLLLITCCLVTAFCIPANAQRFDKYLPSPSLESIYPPGGQKGLTVEVSVRGKDIGTSTEMRFSHQGISATQKFNKAKKLLANQFVVTIAKDVPPGIYEARIVSQYGLSTPRAFVVSSKPEINETEGNDTIDSAQEVAVGTIVNGIMHRTGDADWFRFPAEKGQRILIKCDAMNIDSRMEPTLALFRPDATMLRESYDTSQRDALIDFTAPEKGEYIVKLQGLVYDGSQQFFYRLTIGADPQIEFVFPPAGLANTTGKFTLYGHNLPGGKVAKGVIVDGQTLEYLDVDIPIPSQSPVSDGSIETYTRQHNGYEVTAPSPSTDCFEYRFQNGTVSTNEINIAIATAPVVLEQEPNNDASTIQKVKIPCEIAGQFAQLEDRDWFQFEAKKGEVIQIEVISQRMGITTDPFLVVQQVLPDGSAKDITTVDDQLLNGYENNDSGGKQNARFSYNTRTDDPAYRLVAPAEGTYRVMVREMSHTNRADPRFVYRLSLRHEQPDFRLVAVPHTPTDIGPNSRKFRQWSPQIRRGGTERINLLVFAWDGFNTPIEVTVKGLPADITCPNATIQPGQKIYPLIFTATTTAKPWQGEIEIIAHAKIGDKAVQHLAKAGTMLWDGETQRRAPFSRTMNSMTLSLLDSDAKLTVIAGGKSALFEAKPGMKLSIPIEIKRGDQFDGKVQIANIGTPKTVVTVKSVIFDGKTNTGKVELTVSSKAALGTHTFCFEAQITVTDPRSPPKKPRKIPILISSTPINIVVTKKEK